MIVVLVVSVAFAAGFGCGWVRGRDWANDIAGDMLVQLVKHGDLKASALPKHVALTEQKLADIRRRRA